VAQFKQECVDLPTKNVIFITKQHSILEIYNYFLRIFEKKAAH